MDGAKRHAHVSLESALHHSRRQKAFPRALFINREIARDNGSEATNELPGACMYPFCGRARSTGNIFTFRRGRWRDYTSGHVTAGLYSVERTHRELALLALNPLFLARKAFSCAFFLIFGSSKLKRNIELVVQVNSGLQA